MTMACGTGEDTGWSVRVFDALRGDPNAAAIVSVVDDGFHTTTRNQLLSMISECAEILDRFDVLAGQCVPALLTTKPWSVAMLLAGAFSQRPLAPLGPKMTDQELLGCLTRLDGGLLVAEPEFAEKAHRLAEATRRRVAVIEDRRPAGQPWDVGPQSEGVAYIMHTSGTTGAPKQILARESPMARRAEVNGELLGLRPGARLVIAGLFHHVGGLGNIAVALANDTTVVLYPSFSVDNWRRLEPIAPTHVITVPSVIEMLLSADALMLPSLEVLGYGGAPMHPETMRRILTESPSLDCVELFGQTEGSPLTVLTAADHRAAISGNERLLKSVGRAVPGAELRIHHPDEHGIGEIWMRCAHSFLVDADGWQHTGDLGYLDDGYVYLAGRMGDKIIRGGENVFPVEVEQILESHSQVAEAAVVGIPDQRLGETIRAYIVAAHGDYPPDFEELRAYCRQRLAGFKVPAQWRLVEALPRNPVGKLLRKKVLSADEQLADELGATP
jgi:acyl-CoA synthetase (AMP-forming)/AMP-acid ligase II